MAQVETFWDIPRWVFPGADFVVKCNGDSLEPKLHKGRTLFRRKCSKKCSNLKNFPAFCGDFFSNI